MRRTTLGLLALLFVAGCGGESGGNYASRPSASEPTGTVWVQLQHQLGALNAGKYTATLISQRCSKSTTTDCKLTTQTIRSTGSFTLDPVSVISELRVDRPYDESAGDPNVVQMRELLDGTLYSMDPTGSNSCWTSWAKGYKPTFEVAFRTGLEVLKSAEPSYDLPASGRSIELPAQASALAVIRTLGLPADLDRTYGITAPIRKMLAAKTVTITVVVGTGGQSVSFTADGRQIAAEIHPGTITDGYLSTIQDARSGFSVTDFGVAPAVTAPPADQIKAKNGTCIAG